MENYIKVFVFLILGDMHKKRGDITFNMTNKTYITHYFNYPLPVKGLHDLDFLSTNEEGLAGNFYFAGYDFFQKIPESELESQVREGSIIKLPKAVIGGVDRSLWLDLQGVVYIADSENPYDDKTKKAVYDSRTKKSLL